MIYDSHYPEPPPIPDQNAVLHYLYHPDQKEWQDFTLFIEANSGKKVSFFEFRKRVEDGITALGGDVSQGGLGLGDNDIVGIVSENSIDYVTLAYSLLGNKVVFALISGYSTPFELASAFKLCTISHLFVSKSLFPRALAACKQGGLSPDKIYLLDGQDKRRKSFPDLIDHVRKNGSPKVPIRRTRHDELAYLAASSGTTGLPKAVMVTHGNIMFATLQVDVVNQALLEVQQPKPLSTPEGIPTVLVFLPFHHSYGVYVTFFRAFSAPQTCVIMSKWNVAEGIKAIKQYHITSIPLIPSVVHQILNYPGIQADDLKTIQAVSCGAAYLPPAFAEKLSSLISPDAIFLPGYGLSEAPMASMATPFPGILGGKLPAPEVPHPTGVLYPGQKARIMKDDGTLAKPGEPGELQLFGRNLTKGYWNNKKATEEAFLSDGWLRTGDRFWADKNGYFLYDTLKVSGSQVSPTEIEDCLLAHPKKLIVDVSVAGIKGGRTEDEHIPRAWIVLSATGKELGAQEVISELDAWHKERLSKYKWLRGGIEVIDEIPKSPTGKTLRRVLRERFDAKGKVNSKL
ncbi:amp dependent CoA ligase [Rhodocollybia butyracea]|uniref:Amp dependent CoA ligase n=1 Tax=Rhodocollybia butyracea TaxID=206335 RepID=A0A9P5Q3C2_9AGAR|nr:amp dependent CoA ligase [Rhodocollybia butyracea]